MELGELLTLWTVRVAVALYVLGLALRLGAGRRGRSVARLAWTGGLLAVAAHVACAFHFYHHWSHAAAYDRTAEQTAEAVGLNWGGGLYVNYAFVLLWAADVCWWWRDPEGYLARPSW